METQEIKDMGHTREFEAMASRQLELLAIMRGSDAHAAKCSKLGLAFRDEYPEEFAAYEAAREEYNANGERLAGLAAEESPEGSPEEV